MSRDFKRAWIYIQILDVESGSEDYDKQVLPTTTTTTQMITNGSSGTTTSFTCTYRRTES